MRSTEGRRKSRGPSKEPWGFRHLLVRMSEKGQGGTGQESLPKKPKEHVTQEGRGKVLGCGKLQDPDEFQRSHVTQVAGLQPDDEVLKNLGVLSKWVLWAWFSLLRSLEVKEKEAEDNLALTTNKVESQGRTAQSW